MKRFFVVASVCTAGVLGGCSSGSGAPGDGSGGGGRGDATQKAADVRADDGTASAGLPAAGLVALPATTFVFEHRIRDTPLAAEVIGFDIATAQRRVITDFDGHGSNPSRMAISPDRKWIAFAALFRPTQADLDTKLGARILYAMSGDGSRFHRITPTIQNPWSTHCSDDFACEPLGLTCNTLRSRCEPRNFTLDLHHPAWMADGASVVVDVAQYWSGSTGLEGGQRIAQVPVSGGAPDAVEGSGCTIASGAAVHPSGKTLIAEHGVCSSEYPGLYEWPVPASSAPRLVYRLTVDAMFADRVQWLPDGETIAVGLTGEYGTQDASVRGTGIVAIDVKSGSTTILEAPLTADDSIRITSFAISPDGSHIAMCVRHDGGYDIIVRDRAKLGSSGLSQITDDGHSCYPAW